MYSHVKSCHNFRWIFKMSGKYLIVSDVLSGVWKSVISIPIKEIISCLPSTAIPTYELYSQLVSSDNLWKEKEIQVIIFSLCLRHLPDRGSTNAGYRFQFVFTTFTRSWEHVASSKITSKVSLKYLK